MGNIQSGPEIEWGDLYRRLLASTSLLLRNLTTFRGPRSDSFLFGKQPHDYVDEAIEKYLYCPEKYKPEKGDLFNYLRYNLIRSMVSNDINSAENNKNKDLHALIQNEEKIESYTDATLPYVEALFDQDVDYSTVLSFVEQQINGDEILEMIFLGVTLDLTRRDVILQGRMSEKDYDNGKRRLATILAHTAKHFELKQ